MMACPVLFSLHIYRIIFNCSTGNFLPRGVSLKAGFQNSHHGPVKASFQAAMVVFDRLQRLGQTTAAGSGAVGISRVFGCFLKW